MRYINCRKLRDYREKRSLGRHKQDRFDSPEAIERSHYCGSCSTCLREILEMPLRSLGKVQATVINRLATTKALFYYIVNCVLVGWMLFFCFFAKKEKQIKCPYISYQELTFCPQKKARIFYSVELIKKDAIREDTRKKPSEVN